MTLSRWLLAISLLPLLVAAAVMCRKVPECRLYGINARLHHQRQHVIVFLHRGRLFEERWGILKLDLQTGNLEERFDKPSMDDAERNPYSLHLPRVELVEQTVAHPLGWQRIQARWLDEATEAYGQPVEFEFPDVSGNLYILDRRFAVAHFNNQFVALDLQNPTAGLKSLDHRLSENEWVIVVGTNRFLTVRHEVPAGSVNLANPIIRQVELLTVDESGQPTLIKTWPIGAISSSQWGSASYFGSEIASISPDLKHVQFHSTADGSLVSQLPLPVCFDPTTMDFEFAEQLTVQLPNETHVMDYVSKRWLPRPSGGRHELVDTDPKDGRLLYQSAQNSEQPTKTSQLNVLGAAGQLILSTAIPAGSRCEFLDDNRLVVMSDQGILTVTVLDVETAAVLQVWRPYTWVLPCLITSLIGYLVWSMAWIVTAAQRTGWVWTDAAIVMGIPLLILTVRVLYYGMDHRGVPLDYLHGILIGGFMATIALTTLSNRRISIRFMPTLLFATVVLLMSLLIHHQNYEASYYVGIVSFHALIAFGVAIVTRTLGWRLTQPALESSQQQQKPSIGDLLLVLLCVAVFFAALRLWYGRFAVLPATNLFWEWVVTAIVCSALTMVVAFQPAQKVFVIGVIAAVILYGVLAYEPVERVLLGHAGDTYRHLTASRRSCLTAIVTVAAISSVYRQRDVRFARIV
jgi:hypothetical protein